MSVDLGGRRIIIKKTADVVVVVRAGTELTAGAELEVITLPVRGAGLVRDWRELTQLLFFFQAEGGIRDIGVTGVQTCALPISSPSARYRVVRAAKGMSSSPSRRKAR